MKPAIKRVWVLGAGQLGAMLKHAAQPLGVDLRPVDIELDAILALEDDDVITAEREQWPSTVATDQLAAHANFVNQDVFGLVADRVTQKQLLDRSKFTDRTLGPCHRARYCSRPASAIWRSRSAQATHGWI